MVLPEFVGPTDFSMHVVHLNNDAWDDATTGRVLHLNNENLMHFALI